MGGSSSFDSISSQLGSRGAENQQEGHLLQKNEDTLSKRDAEGRFAGFFARHETKKSFKAADQRSEVNHSQKGRSEGIDVPGSVKRGAGRVGIMKIARMGCT